MQQSQMMEFKYVNHFKEIKNLTRSNKNPLGNGVNNPKHIKPDNQTQIIEFNK